MEVSAWFAGKYSIRQIIYYYLIEGEISEERKLAGLE
jgi:hypothetical protein